MFKKFIGCIIRPFFTISFAIFTKPLQILTTSLHLIMLIKKDVNNVSQILYVVMNYNLKPITHFTFERIGKNGGGSTK